MVKINDANLVKQFILNSHYLAQFSTDITAQTQLIKFPAQSFIVKESATPEYIYYLVKGRAKLYDVMANGKVTLIDFFTPPCFIGEMELINPASTLYSVQAIEDCWCLAVSIRDNQSQLLNDPVFLKHVCIYLAQKNTRNIETASQNQSFSLAERLAAFILLTTYHPHYAEKHTQVAAYLGVSYRHLLYVLAQFVKAGYLVKDKPGYLVTNGTALQELSRDVTNSNR